MANLEERAAQLVAGKNLIQKIQILALDLRRACICIDNPDDPVQLTAAQAWEAADMLGSLAVYIDRDIK